MARSTTSNKPDPNSKPKPGAGKSADELLTAARKASVAGSSRKAYSLASQSYGKKRSSAAAEVMVVAACKMKNPGQAKSALSKVKLMNRRKLKQRCQSLGVKL